MCHQTVSLIARALEEAGIATTSVSAARDITAAARPARAVFVDFPHGHTTGRLGDPSVGDHIVRAALDLLSINQADTLVDLDLVWADTDDWKNEVFMPVSDDSGGEARMVDGRSERYESPQYQSVADEGAAAESHQGEECLVCVGIDI